MALSASDIQSLLASSRTKGAGEEVLRDFLGSGEAGIEVDLTSGPLAGKTADQAATSLNNAKKRTRTSEDGSTVLAIPEAAKVRVIKRGKDEDGKVFLINMDEVTV